MKRITRAEARPGNVVRLQYDNGETVEVNFTDTIARGGLFARLRDETFFRQLAVGEGGRYIQWPEGLDFCADALYERAHTSV